MAHEILPTGRKALQINLDTNFYGTFAEIGGGQEVARHFFQAGGASGTIAKTISAYDKLFSDAKYCLRKKNNERYVSEDRLNMMLDGEYEELEKVLSGKKPDTRFFVYADTVEVLNYQKTNYSHGWLGFRFQLNPRSKPNTIIMHVKLLENDGQLQQTTLGILGVNLIHAGIHYYDKPWLFLESLIDNLSRDRFSINAIFMSGPELDYVDNRLLAVQLVKTGMSPAIMFDKNGNVQQPSDMLYKKNVLAFRGSFRPITYISWDILGKSMDLFKKDEDYQEDNTLSFCEITLNNLISSDKEINEKDFLERVYMLNEIGQNVMVSNFREYYRLVEFFGQFKMKKLRIVMGVPTLEKVMDDKYYKHLKGGLLEAAGKMFPNNLKFYIYPTLLKSRKENKLITAANIRIKKKYKLLYDFLIENKYLLEIQSDLSDQLIIKSREVLKMIQDEDPEWEKYVPMAIANRIKEKNLFKD